MPTDRDAVATCAFYHDVLGMQIQGFENGRLALRFRSQKINLHEVGHEIDPKAAQPTSGSGDICLLIEDPLSDLVAVLRERRIDSLGPAHRTGARGGIDSVHVRDPDGNLVELSVYAASESSSWFSAYQQEVHGGGRGGHKTREQGSPLILGYALWVTHGSHIWIQNES